MPFTGTTTPDLKNVVEFNIYIGDTNIQEEFNTTTNGSVFLCEVAYEDSGAFLRDMLGYAEVVGSSLQRVLPERSLWDDDQYAVAANLVKSITWEDNEEGVAAGYADPEEGWPRFNRSVYAVTFAAPLYRVREDDEVDAEYERFVVWREKGVVQNEKIPGGGFKFVTANKEPLYEVAVKVGRTLQLTAKWLDVPEIDVERLTGYCNKVNNDTLEWNGRTYAADTVLFDSFDVEPRNNSFGDPTNDVTLNFLVRIDGRTWNHFWLSGANGYVLVTSDGTLAGDRPFEGANLNAVWEFA